MDAVNFVGIGACLIGVLIESSLDFKPESHPLPALDPAMHRICGA